MFAWICGILDILDGKIARKYSLSSQFGIQLDSFADFFSFVILPCVFLYFAIFENIINDVNIFTLFLITFAFVYYIVSGARRLVVFNIDTSDEVAKYFVGMPTPLGAICLWAIYLLFIFTTNISLYVFVFLMMIVAYLLNSKIKIHHL